MNHLTSLSLNLSPRSLVNDGDIEYGLANMDKGQRLAILAPKGASLFADFSGGTSEHAGKTLLLGELNGRNATSLRKHIGWLQPRPLGLQTSAGMGDRLGQATPGHVRATRAVGKIAPIFAQQSIREMERTERTPQQVMDDATWGIFAEGWRDGVGADADHLKVPADIDATVPVGYSFFTIDPGEHVDNSAETAPLVDLRVKLEQLPWNTLEDNAKSMTARYLNKSFDIDVCEIRFDEHTLLRAAAKYGKAVAHVAMMYRYLAAKRIPFEFEVSVDETELPTSHAEHVFVTSELKRLGVKWVSLAPRYIGRFEKGVDYLGDVKAFEDDFAIHAAIARVMGPYKLSLHSGSDKFSVYAITARLTDGLVHLKTAGTSYLEALRTIGPINPALFREIYLFARERYTADRVSYHVSAELTRAPRPDQLKDSELAQLLDQFDAREILHVTFGSVLTMRKPDGSALFHDRLKALLNAYPEAYAANLEKHFIRHLTPFVS